MVTANREAELADLVGRIARGDPPAEEEIVRRYKDAVSLIIGRIVRNPAAAEDVAQDALLKVIEKVRQGVVREPSRISGFICAIARNLALEYVRKWKQATGQEEDGGAERVPDPTLNPYEQLCRKERSELIRRVLAELPVERDRELLLQYYIAERDKAEICADFGLTSLQFNGVIFRALGRYRELYLKRFGNL